MPNRILTGKRVYLRKVLASDVNENYLRWMTDPETTQYLESRFYKHTIKSLRQYVLARQKDKGSIFLAIVLKKDNRHIGNIKLGPIDKNHKIADIGILIGEKDCWGKGYAKEAIGLIIRYAFNMLGLHKLTAGCYAPNKGSFKAFRAQGFIQEGLRKSHCYYRGRYVDDILLGLIRRR